MTEEELIADYMGWRLSAYDGGYYYIPKNGRVICFDSNDASLCVQEMQKRGDWQKFCATGFVIYFEKERPSHVFPENYVAWLFNAENFFTAMSGWLKERGK